MAGEDGNGVGNGQVAAGDYTPKNILITGGAGFIASHVASRLVKNYGHYTVRGRGPGLLHLNGGPPGSRPLPRGSALCRRRAALH